MPPRFQKIRGKSILAPSRSGVGDAASGGVSIAEGGVRPALDAAEERIPGLPELNGNGQRVADLVETISTLSHEFRTPLASMRSSLNLVLQEEAGPLVENQRHFLGMTLRNIDRLERLVRDLLDVSRADAGKLPLHLRDVDLGPILADAVAMHQSEAQRADLVLDSSGLPNSFGAHVDPDKVLQMLANVLGNAVKYCNSGGRIRVWLEQGVTGNSQPGSGPGESRNRPVELFEIVVQDNGPGIDPARLGGVFDPFCRVHDESECRVFGAGLGLHITRGLAEAHSGQIHLSSEPGQGTTVRIRLPRWQATGKLGQVRPEMVDSR